MRYRVVLVLFLAGVTATSVVVAATGPTTEPTTGPSRSVNDGIYSAIQVARGKKSYSSLCARCHGDNLLGNDDAPALVDNDFLGHWYGKTLGKLVDLTWKKMPTDGPGRLNRRQSTDITTYLLSENGYPVGKSDLPPDAGVLNGILIQRAKQ